MNQFNHHGFINLNPFAQAEQIFIQVNKHIEETNKRIEEQHKNNMDRVNNSKGPMPIKMPNKNEGQHMGMMAPGDMGMMGSVQMGRNVGPQSAACIIS